MSGILPANGNDDATESQSALLNPILPIPYTYDLGNLSIFDSNPLPHKPTPSQIHSTARNNAQSLLNQLLLTCPIHTSQTTASVLMTLPPPTTPLPREKRLPDTKKSMTKWEKFAEKKGIGKVKRDDRGKMEYDEERGEWVRKWGYKGKGMRDEQEEWIVEVDEKKEQEKNRKGKTGGNGGLGEGRRERMERARRNERKMRANERRERKNGVRDA